MAPDAQRPLVLITGAAGFIGFHLSKKLLEAGWRVLGIDNINDYYDPALKKARIDQLAGAPDFAFSRLDICNHEALADLFAVHRPQAVVHLAAQAGVRYSLDAPRAYTSANVDGFLGVLEACRHFPVEHLIFASSSSVYGANAKAPFAETDAVDHPVSLYAATKRANELMAHTYANLFAIPSTGLRFFTVYGPWGRPDMAYFSFTKNIFEGRPIELYDADRMMRDFTYVDDIVEGISRLLAVPPGSAATVAPNAGRLFRVFNIGNDEPTPLRTFLSVLEDCIGRKAVVIDRPIMPGDSVPERMPKRRRS